MIKVENGSVIMEGSALNLCIDYLVLSAAFKEDVLTQLFAGEAAINVARKRLHIASDVPVEAKASEISDVKSLAIVTALCAKFEAFAEKLQEENHGQNDDDSQA